MLDRLGRSRLLAAPLLAGALLAACGDDDEEGGGAEARTVSVEVTEPAKGRVEIRAPKSIPAGLVNIEVRNSGKRPHDAQLIRLEGDRTVEEFLKVIGSEGGPIPAWIQDGGGVGETPPGGSRSATQVLEEGRWYFVSQGEGRRDTATARLEVTAGEEEATLPEADAKVTARDYSFTTSGLKPGRNRIEFENVGRELHHLIAAPILPGRTIEDVRKFAQEERPSGRPPIDVEGSGETAVIDGGVSQLTDIELKRGKYALLCFIQDRKGGPPHVAKGMVTEATVE